MTLPPWLRIALGMFAVSYGANLFAPLLPVMRDVHGLGQAPVNLILAVYVLGLIPALMVGGPLSDRRGRRAVVRPALLFSAVGTLVTLSAHLGVDSTWGPVLLSAGRMLTGVAVGLVLAAGASWLKEVTVETAGADGAAARRATAATSAGFGVGPLVSGPVAEWLPGPDTTPLIIHLVMILVLTPLVWVTPDAGRRAASRLQFPPSARTPRFLFTVALWAPWAFGLATTSFAVLPPLVTAGVSAPVAYTGLIAGVAMLTGTFVQPWAGRLPTGARITPPVYALGTAVIGMGAAVGVVTTHAVWFLVPTAMILGTAYGIMMVSGLREVQRIAAPEELGSLTAVFYALTYLGFFMPFVIALVAPLVGYVTVFLVGAVVCVVSMVVTTRHSHPF
ncbi:MFS transporter [Corynebacterium glyciniphilum]|uniref:MFS transporter n=1 Tax=Corynebacterium glyciniphilum TaxID=1404244 RepID=UPI002654FEE6|nr:MFS transporter [Corynebacterium glyciniphilum]MDN5683101.1 MFS transporter [Corynebacterium glyciniphilum]MDN6706980.1 MFS transporter [Corynebacterium glyciniphilum]